MRRAIILFLIIFATTLLIPAITLIKPASNGSKLVTLFNACLYFFV